MLIVIQMIKSLSHIHLHTIPSYMLKNTKFPLKSRAGLRNDYVFIIGESYLSKFIIKEKL